MTDLALPLAPADDPLERARLHIESRLFEPLTLTELAAAAGLSAYHFSRQFGARFGASPMAYVRAMRMAAAAAQLCGQTPPPLVDLAFDSQEGFTRAFKRAFGVPPGRYRRAGVHPMETLLMSTAATAPAVNLTQAADPVRKGPLRIAGLAGQFDDTNKAGIPALWERFAPRLPFDGQAGYETYGVCAAGAGAEPGSMRYMAGVALRADAAPPEGLEVIVLAPQTYLVFHQTLDAGPLQPQMLAAARAIWGDLVPKSGHRLAQAPDLEFYPADFEPNRAGWVEWWVPVEG
jgi:AraC family transcriptional regulator